MQSTDIFGKIYKKLKIDWKFRQKLDILHFSWNLQKIKWFFNKNTWIDIIIK
jgi:hypothetical protein